MSPNVNDSVDKWFEVTEKYIETGKIIYSLRQQHQSVVDLQAKPLIHVRNHRSFNQRRNRTCSVRLFWPLRFGRHNDVTIFSPLIKLACVVGISDEMGNDLLTAVIVPTEGSQIIENGGDIIRYRREIGNFSGISFIWWCLFYAWAASNRYW